MGMLAQVRRCAARAPLLPRAAARLYHEKVVDHYESPRNVGSFDKSDPDVGTGLVGAPACGDVMKLQMRVVDGKVEQAVFKVHPPPVMCYFPSMTQCMTRRRRSGAVRRL